MYKKGLYMFIFVIALAVSITTVAQASYNNEAFENERFSGAGDGTFSLTYLGRGCPATGDPNDYRYRVNINRSYVGSDWKFFSNNSYYQRTPSGRFPYGFQLDKPSNGYICLGYKEFSRIFHPFSAWDVNGVAQNVYTWRR